MGNWAELGEDLLALTIKRVALYEDFLSFRGVCRAWHSVAVDENFKGFEQIPWLMLSEKDNSDERQFVSLRKGIIRTEARGKRCLETLGWLVIISEDGGHESTPSFFPGSNWTFTCHYLQRLRGW